MLAAVLEDESGAGNKVLDRARDEHLVGRGNSDSPRNQLIRKIEASDLVLGSAVRPVRAAGRAAPRGRSGSR